MNIEFIGITEFVVIVIVLYLLYAHYLSLQKPIVVPTMASSSLKQEYGKMIDQIKKQEIEPQNEEIHKVKEDISKLQETLQQNKEIDEDKIKEQQRTYDEKFAQIDNENESIRHLIDQQTEEQRQRNTEQEKLNQQVNEVKERTEKLEADIQNEREAREKAEQQTEEQRRLDTEHEKLDQQFEKMKKRLDKLEADMQADREAKVKADQEARKQADREREPREPVQRPQPPEFAAPSTCKELVCKGRPCANCHKCRDWHFTGDQETWNWICDYKNWKKVHEDRWRKNVSTLFEKRGDATCTSRIAGHIGAPVSFSFGLSIGGGGTTVGTPYASLCLCENH